MNKNCSNCGAGLSEDMKFCPTCGAPLSESPNLPKTKDFFKEFINYDQNIWRTIKKLLLKPGTLTREFISGNHQKVTSPVKIFIIVSAIAFLFGSISLTKSSPEIETTEPDISSLPLNERPQLQLEFETSTGVRIHNLEYYKKELDSLGAEQFMIQRGLKPGDIRFWVVKRTLKKYQENDYKPISSKHERNASFLLYLLIPIFAFFMKMFRWKRSFTEHITFTLYFFSTFYLLGLLSKLIGKVAFYVFSIKFLGIIFAPLTIVYLTIAIHRNYRIKWIFALPIGLLTGTLLLVSIALLLFFSSLLILAL